MYNLGEQFKINKAEAIANKKSIIQGANYRFTILTERLIRLEYNDNGVFVDSPTQQVLYRNLKTPEFKVKEDPNFLVITTKYFKLTYLKVKSFLGGKASPATNLKVELLNTDHYWYYGHPEVRNFGKPNSSLEEGTIEGKGL